MKYKVLFIVTISLLAIIVISTVFYCFIQVAPTDQVFNYAKSVMNGEIQPEKSDPLYRYSIEARGSDAVSSKCTIWRKWVWHDAVFGYIHVKYLQRFYDETGEATAWSLSIDAIWVIYKIQDEWVVVDVIEHP